MKLYHLLRALLRYDANLTYRRNLERERRWMVTVHGHNGMTFTAIQPTLLKALRETVGRMSR